MSIDFPITGEALLTVLGSAAFAAVISMWFKHYLPDWRWTNLFVLGISEMFAVAARLIVGGPVTWPGILGAVLVGIAGASLATFGYEAVTNWLGLAGIGKRSDVQLLAEAERTVLEKDA